MGAVCCLAGVALAGGPEPASDIDAPARVDAFLETGSVRPFSHERLLEAGPLAEGLSLGDLVKTAGKRRLEEKLSREKINEALGHSLQSLSSLLPHLEGGVSQSRTFKENLEAQGLSGFGVIGPFNTFDARFKLEQKIIDIGAISRFQTGRARVKTARYEKDLASQHTVLAAALAYLDALRAQGAYQAAQAGVALSERLLRQAQALQQAGTAAAIDVARATTRLAEDQLRLQRSRTGLHDAYLEVQRLAGLPYDDVIRLTDCLCFVPEDLPPVDQALALATRQRVDMRVAEERVRAAGFALKGARGEWFPVVAVSGNYGVSGVGPRHGDQRTSGIMIGATMPLFEGGRVVGEIKEAASIKRQAELMRDDLKRQVEEDVRKALWTMMDSTDQAVTAARIVELSRREMDLAGRRFGEGLADHLVVAAAQATLAQARDGYVAALAQYHAARMNLDAALGQPGAFNLKPCVKQE